MELYISIITENKSDVGGNIEYVYKPITEDFKTTIKATIPNLKGEDLENYIKSNIDFILDKAFFSRIVCKELNCEKYIISDNRLFLIIKKIDYFKYFINKDEYTIFLPIDIDTLK